MPVALREKLEKEVPESCKTKEFKLLLNLIKENKISSLELLKSFILTKVGTLNLEMSSKKVHDSHPSDEMRKIAKEIDVLKSMQEQFFRFLK